MPEYFPVTLFIIENNLNVQRWEIWLSAEDTCPKWNY